jgi:hypothetical protein
LRYHRRANSTSIDIGSEVSSPEDPVAIAAVLHDKYYLFLTFDSATKFPEQWRNWLPRMRRGSQILVGASPLGPFAPFASRPTLPEDMMTLDGTLWVEDGVPYMVYCHEWV